MFFLIVLSAARFRARFQSDVPSGEYGKFTPSIMNKRQQKKASLWVRTIAIVLSQLLCLPSPDLLAQSSPKSVFATKQASHTAVRERNLRELDAKQGMLGRKDKEQGQGTTSTVKPQDPLSLAALQDLSAINVPPEDGQILEVWSPADRGGQVSSPTVILLQDLHTQAEAQQAEGRILQHLHKTYNLKLVAAEGAEGPFALEFFKQFPEDAKLRADVAKTFLAAGELTGHEYEIITKQLPITVYGVEDMALHAENTEAYRQVLDVAPAAQEAIVRIQQALAALEPKLYPAPLQALRAHVEQFQGGALAMPEYVGYVSELAQHHGVSMDTVAPNLVRFQQLQTMEQAIDRDQVQAELQQLLGVIAERHQRSGFSTRSARSNENETRSSSSEAPEGRGVEKQPRAERESDEFAVLLDQFQRQAIAPAYFYPRLVALAQQASVDMSVYASVVAFAAYLELTHALQHHRLLPELEQLEWALTERLAGSEDAKTLATLVRHALLLHDLFSLKLTPDQWAYVQAHREEFTAEAFTAFLERQERGFSTRSARSNENSSTSSGAPEGRGVEKLRHDLAGILDAVLPLAERFYVLAHQRDRVLCERTLALLQGLGIGDRGRAVFAATTGASVSLADNPAKPTTNDERRTTSNGRAEAVLLVAGGFHTPGVTALLRERQIPYVVVTPTAAGELDEALYHRLIRAQRATLGELVTLGQQPGAMSSLPKPGLLAPKESSGTSSANAGYTALAVCFLAALFVAFGAATGAELANPEMLTQAKHLLEQTLALATEAGVSPEHLDQLSASVQQGFEALQRAVTEVQQHGGNARELLQPAIDNLQTALNQLQQSGTDSQLGTQLAELGADGALAVGESDISRGIGSIAGAAVMMKVRPGASVSYAPSVDRVSLGPLGVTGELASVSGLEIDLMKMLSGPSLVSMGTSASPQDFPLTSQEFVAFMNYIVDLRKAGYKSANLLPLIEKEIDRSIDNEAAKHPVGSTIDQNAMRRRQWKEAAKSLLDKAFTVAKQGGYIGLQRFGDRWYQRVPSGGFVLIPVSVLPEEEGVWSIQLGHDDPKAQITVFRDPQAKQKDRVVLGAAESFGRSMNPLVTLDGNSRQEFIAGTEGGAFGRIQLLSVSGVDKKHAVFSRRRPHLIGELGLSMFCVSDGQPDWGLPSKGGTWIPRTVDALQNRELRRLEATEERDALDLAYQVSPGFVSRDLAAEQQAIEYAAEAQKQGFDLPQMVQRNPSFAQQLQRVLGAAVFLALLIYFNLPVDQALESQELVDASQQLGTLAELGTAGAMVLPSISRRQLIKGAGLLIGGGAIVILAQRLGLTWLLPGEERKAPTDLAEQYRQEAKWLRSAFNGSSIPRTESAPRIVAADYMRVNAGLYGDGGQRASEALQQLARVSVYGGQEIAQLQRSAAAPALEFGTRGYTGYAADFAENARDHLALRLTMIGHYLDFALTHPELPRSYAVGVLRSLAGEFVTLGQGAYDAAQRLGLGVTLPEILKTLTRANAIDQSLEAVETLLTSWQSKESEAGIVQEIGQGIADVQRMRETWKEFLQQRSEQRPDQTQPAGIEEDVPLSTEQLAFTTWFDPQTGVVWSESRGKEATRDATTLYSARIVEPGLDWVERRLEVELERGTSRPRGVNDVLTTAGAEGPAAIGSLTVFGNRFLGLLQYVATGKVRFSLFDSGDIEERAERSVGNDVRHRNVADVFHGWVYRGTDEEFPLQLRSVVGVLEGEQVFTNQQRAAYHAVAATEEPGRKVLTYESYPLLGLQQARTIWQAVEQAGLGIKWLEVQMYDPSSSHRIGGQAWKESGAVSEDGILELGPDSFLAAWSDAEPFVNVLMGRVSEMKRQQIRGIKFDFTRERSALSAPITRTNDQGEQEQVRVLIIGRDLFSIPLDTKSMEDRLLQPLREKGVLKKGGIIPILPQLGQSREAGGVQRDSQTVAAIEQPQTPPSSVSLAVTSLTPVRSMGPGFNPLAAGFHQDVRDEGRTAPATLGVGEREREVPVIESATGTGDLFRNAKHLERVTWVMPISELTEENFNPSQWSGVDTVFYVRQGRDGQPLREDVQQLNVLQAVHTGFVFETTNHADLGARVQAGQPLVVLGDATAYGGELGVFDRFIPLLTADGVISLAATINAARIRIPTIEELQQIQLKLSRA